MSDLVRMIHSYRDQYGAETDALFEAMVKPQDKIALINPFLPALLQEEIISHGQRAFDCGPQFARLPTDYAPATIDGLMSHYFLDQSSIFAPLLLPLAPGMRVLDMCSAPGGKLLVMLSRKIPNLNFIANDISSARNARLRKVIKDYVPEHVAKDMLRVTTKDAVHFGLKESQSFDAVLLDAPCSSEAHIIKDPQLLAKFSGVRANLPYRQFSLLSAALLALKPGGHVMYATCTINRAENEGVIKKALQRKKLPCELVSLSSPLGEVNEGGVTILPHRDHVGPAFFSLLKRL